MHVLVFALATAIAAPAQTLSACGRFDPHPPKSQVADGAIRIPPKARSPTARSVSPPRARSLTARSVIPPKSQVADGASVSLPSARSPTAPSASPQGQVADGAIRIPPKGQVADGAIRIPPKSQVADGAIRIPPKSQVADGAIRIPPKGQVADGAIRIPPKSQVAEAAGSNLLEAAKDRPRGWVLPLTRPFALHLYPSGTRAGIVSLDLKPFELGIAILGQSLVLMALVGLLVRKHIAAAGPSACTSPRCSSPTC